MSVPLHRNAAPPLADEETAPDRKISPIVRAWPLAGIVAATGLAGLAGQAFLPDPMVGALMLAVLCIGLWATAVLPEYWTALAFFLAAVVLGIAPAATVFSGFRSSTFWLLFGGLVLGAAIRHTGLDQPQRSVPVADARRTLSRWSAGEKRLAVVLALSLVLWLSDGLHHVSPTWVSLAAALYCLWPGAGLTSTRCLNEEINHGSLLFVAGIMGLGAVIAVSGLGASLVRTLGEHAGLGTGRPLRNVTALTVLSSLVATLTTLPGVPAVMTPLAGELARTTGLPLETVLMTQVLGFSNVLLPYQSPPLLAAIALGHLPAGAAAKLCLVLFLVTMLALTPLDLLWWHLIGWL